MSSGRWPFKPSAVKRAIAIAHAAGLRVTGITQDGTVLTSNNKETGDAPQPADGGAVNPWDEVLGDEPH